MPSLSSRDHVPNFELPDQKGNFWILGEQLGRGPAVLVFYRGDWWPYCNGQLVSYARNHQEFERRGAQVVGISVDTIAKNAAMVEKLLLPFPLLSDAQGGLIQRFGVWNADEHIAVPTIAVVDQAGTIVYFYSGRDFADRPGDAAIFEGLDATERGASYPEEEPEIRVTAEEAQQSVGPDKRAMTMEELLPYYRGAFFASVALKGRMAALGERGRDAVHEITNYQRLVRQYRDALQATATMKE